jgi:transposase InsO family protein
LGWRGLRGVHRRRYSRAIVGWAAATSKTAPLVVAALKMAIWRRDHDGHKVQKGLIHHSDAGRSTRAPGSWATYA